MSSNGRRSGTDWSSSSVNRRTLTAALLLATLVLAPQAVQAQDAGPIYVVQEGDTLIGIAASFGTTAEALASANGLADPSAIFPGMRLLIPGYEGVSGVLGTVPVEAGESLESLALRYGMSADGLARLNRLANPAGLYVGQSLIVPTDESSSPLLPVGLRFTAAPSGLISRAVETGSNPWTIARWNRLPSALWIDPARHLYLPADPASPDALPEGWTALELRPDRPGQGRTLLVEALLTDGASISGKLGEHDAALRGRPRGSGPSRRPAGNPRPVRARAGRAAPGLPPGDRVGGRIRVLPACANPGRGLRQRVHRGSPRDDRPGQHRARGRADRGGRLSGHTGSPVGRTVRFPHGLLRELPVVLRNPAQLQRCRMELLPHRPRPVRLDLDRDPGARRRGSLCSPAS